MCFLAAIGGLLGLGFGFSFISAMELFYFFSVRMYFTSKEKSKNLIHSENSINRRKIPVRAKKEISANNIVTKRGKMTNTIQSSLRRTTANGKIGNNIPSKK